MNKKIQKHIDLSKSKLTAYSIRVINGITRKRYRFNTKQTMDFL